MFTWGTYMTKDRCTYIFFFNPLPLENMEARLEKHLSYNATKKMIWLLVLNFIRIYRLQKSLLYYLPQVGHHSAAHIRDPNSVLFLVLAGSFGLYPYDP